LDRVAQPPSAVCCHVVQPPSAGRARVYTAEGHCATPLRRAAGPQNPRRQYQRASGYRAV